MKTYEDLVRDQIEQYRHVENIHDLPEIYHYWSSKFLAPKLNEIFGVCDIIAIYADWMARGLRAGESKTLTSVGAGDGTVEIQIAAKLKSMGFEDFVFECLEISPLLIERGNEKIAQAGLAQNMKFVETDLNNWHTTTQYAGVIANHSLHHIVALELVFETIRKNLTSGAYFVTSDMIGRNGHMRWPETLAIVQSVWDRIPVAHRYNRQLQRLEEDFYINHDCSNEGFEGIRAQDIMALLTSNFHFTRACAWGGLTDIFIDRGYGHNFSPQSEFDTHLIDELAIANEALIKLGYIKPTQIIAVMSNEASDDQKLLYGIPPQDLVRPVNLDVFHEHGRRALPATNGKVAICRDASQFHKDGWLENGATMTIRITADIKHLEIIALPQAKATTLSVYEGANRMGSIRVQPSEPVSWRIPLKTKAGAIHAFTFYCSPIVRVSGDQRELALRISDANGV